MSRAIPTGKMSKFMGCIIEGPIEMLEGAENEGSLGVDNVLDNVPVWGPNSRFIDRIYHYGSITFKDHAGKLWLLSKQDTLLHSKDFHQVSRVVSLKRLAESSNCSTFVVSNDDSNAGDPFKV
ncbi:hypothetical protein ACB098_11G021900 [Castanea mollissima]